VARNDLENARKILEDLVVQLDAKELRADAKIAKVSIVGVGMRSHA
jgi:aspartate kinase